MKKFFLSTNMVAFLIIFACSAYAQEKQPMAAAKKTVVATTPISPTKTSVPTPTPIQTSSVTEIIGASKIHTTLLVALKATNLLEALQGAGPFTVFAPTNDAFAKIPTTTLDNLLKPESKEALSKTLSAHVVAGNVSADDILAAIKNGSGTASFTTIAGEKLNATLEGGKVKIADAAGNAAFVTTANLSASNGVVHVIDAVLGK